MSKVYDGVRGEIGIQETNNNGTEVVHFLTQVVSQNVYHPRVTYVHRTYQ